MQLLVGLGNPGAKYERTRHNVGFLAVERILARAGGHWTGATEDAVTADIEISDHEVVLLKPLSFMNLSGGPVERCMTVRGLTPADLLVIYDDVALPLGKIRLRPRGGAGGHRGLQSILEELEGENVPRCRIGVAPAEGQGPEEDLADFVLSEFEDEEKEMVDRVLERVAEAVDSVVVEGMTLSMSKFNGTIA